jgi:hypothetical protein
MTEEGFKNIRYIYLGNSIARVISSKPLIHAFMYVLFFKVPWSLHMDVMSIDVTPSQENISLNLNAYVPNTRGVARH